MKIGSGVPCDSSANIHNGLEFRPQEEAQRCYEHYLKELGYDVDRLDRNNDAFACESLP